jgi:hypothetical protein
VKSGAMKEYLFSPSALIALLGADLFDFILLNAKCSTQSRMMGFVCLTEQPTLWLVIV